MGASVRKNRQNESRAGCESLTNAPVQHNQLGQSDGELPRALVNPSEQEAALAPIAEAEFRFEHNESAMASEKLADGIRRFVVDQRKLEGALA
jgi:transaldolase